jgi:hypothetical protein
MIEIVLSVCLLAEPQRCRDEHVTVLAENATPFQCMRYGQLESVKWSEAHPKWSIKRWTCRPAGQVANL